MCGAGEGPGGQGCGGRLLKEFPCLFTFLKVRQLSILSLGERGVRRTDITVKYPLYLPLLSPTVKKLGGSSSKVAPFTTEQDDTNDDHRVSLLSAHICQAQC